jgi:glycosyltransferase involved in cell wall biosynthesis
MSIGDEGRRPRLLMLAAACCPGRGSEPGVGWHRAVQAARYCDTWVLCPENENSQVLRRHLATHGDIPGLNFSFVPRGPVLNFLSRVPGLYYTSYNLWHRRAYRVARQLHAEVGFDLVHQVTLCGYREPGYLWRLGVPFVWGPVGGTQNYPWRFLGQAGWLGGLREALRSVANRVQLRFSPRVRRAAREAAALLAANSTVQRDFARAHGRTPELLLETGLPQVAEAPREPRPGPLRLLWSGELCPWKALSLLIEALARLPGDVAWELNILGRGPLQGRWQRLAARRQVADRIRWLGWLPHAEALRQYDWADLFVFTSLRDTSGNVVLEALASGVPVVCLDHQGVRDMVTPACGVKIPVTRPGEVIDRLAAALTGLARDPAARAALAAGALERAREYHWDRQGERMAELYQRVLDGRSDAVIVEPRDALPDPAACPS